MILSKRPISFVCFFLFAIHGALGGLSSPYFIVLGALIILEQFEKTRAFLFGVGPMLLYVAIYDLVRYLPVQWRRPVDVNTLLDFETFLFGGLPHEWFKDHHSSIWDIIAATPYNLHFYVPVISAAILWWKNKTVLKNLTWAFLLMNIAALITQLLWPTAAPWYYDLYGRAAANPLLPGYASGLLRVDVLLGVSYFENLYSMGAIVFGAFPSMHGAWPVLLTLCTWSHYRKVSIAFFFYGVWMWWAAVYLGHHYVIDLVGGALYALLSYRLIVSNFQKK